MPFAVNEVQVSRYFFYSYFRNNFRHNQPTSFIFFDKNTKTMRFLRGENSIIVFKAFPFSSRNQQFVNRRAYILKNIPLSKRAAQDETKPNDIGSFWRAGQCGVTLACPSSQFIQ